MTTRTWGTLSSWVTKSTIFPMVDLSALLELMSIHISLGLFQNIPTNAIRQHQLQESLSSLLTECVYQCWYCYAKHVCWATDGRSGSSTYLMNSIFIKEVYIRNATKVETYLAKIAICRWLLMINPAKFSVGVVTSWQCLGVVISL